MGQTERRDATRTVLTTEEHGAVVPAIGRRDRMIAYAKAARRVKEQAAQEGQSG